MNRRSFLRLLGLAPIAAPVAAAGMAQAGYATGGVLPAGQFIFGEMATGSFLPVSFGVGRTHEWITVDDWMASWADAVDADPDRHVITGEFEDPGEIAEHLRQVIAAEPGPIRPVIAPDEAQRSDAFRGLVERGSVEEQPQ